MSAVAGLKIFLATEHQVNDVNYHLIVILHSNTSLYICLYAWHPYHKLAEVDIGEDAVLDCTLTNMEVDTVVVDDTIVDMTAENFHAIQQ